jgi:hypothetical protein
VHRSGTACAAVGTLIIPVGGYASKSLSSTVVVFIQKKMLIWKSLLKPVFFSIGCHDWAVSRKKRGLSVYLYCHFISLTYLLN